MVAELPNEPAAVPLALDHPRLHYAGAWRKEPTGMIGRAAAGTQLSFRSNAPLVTLRFATSPLNGIVAVTRGGETEELDLFDQVPHLPRELVVRNPNGTMVDIVIAPTGRAHPEAEAANATLVGIDEHIGPLQPLRPREVPPAPAFLPPLIGDFAKLARELPAGARALNIGAGYGGALGKGCIHLDWLPFEGPDLLADPLALPFRSNSMELVHCAGVLNRVADPARLMAEIRRVLKPGGRALVSAAPSHWRRFGSPHLLDINLAGMKALSAGFASAEVRGSGTPTDRVLNMLRMGRVNMQGQAARVAHITEELDALAALAPRMAREMPFWTVADLRK
jgi:SAM-dependent methyltransferase